MSICACMGPQNGEPLCPCAMRAVKGYTSFNYVAPGPWAPAPSEEVAALKEENDRLRAIISRIQTPTAEMRRLVAADWGRRTWRQYAEVIAEALQQ